MNAGETTDTRDGAGRDLLGRAARWAARHARGPDRDDAAQEFAAAWLAVAPRARASTQPEAYSHTAASRAAMRLVKARRQDRCRARAISLIVYLPGHSVVDSNGSGEDGEAGTEPAVAAALEKALAGLSGRERRILRLRWMDGLTLEACGKRVGLSGEGVRRAELQALGRLRYRLLALGISPDGV